MRQSIATIFILGILGLGGCSSSKPMPDCSKRPDPSKLTGAERAAFNDSLARFGERCKRQETQCEIKLTHNKRGEILVSVATVYPHQESGQCSQAPGDLDLAVYSQAGDFIRTVMVL